MRTSSIKLYGFTAPLALLPLMDFSFGAIIPYLKGAEFRVILAGLLTEVYATIFDTLILAGLQNLFGVTPAA